MYSLKLAHLIKEHTGAEVFNFYIDMRTPGKGYEEFYDRLLDEGVHFVRGRVAEVSDWAVHPSEEGKLVIRAEDTLAGFVRRIPVDMVVLSVGLEPQTDAQDVRRLFNISCSSEGWFLERHPKLAPVSTFTEGIYIAGACQGPKDIPDSVAQAGAAAAEALALIDAQSVDAEATGANIFFVKDGSLHTPIADCFLNGITRQSVIAIAKAHQIPVIKRHILPDELPQFSECFITGSAAEVTPVSEIGPYRFKPGKLTETLMNAYAGEVRGKQVSAAYG